jgi:hypothetical protein
MRMMMNARRIAATGLIGGSALLLIAQANWNLDKPNTIAGGDLKCSQLGEDVVIWEEQYGGDKPVPCALIGTYRASRTGGLTCTADLSWVTAGGEHPGTKPIDKDAGDKAFNVTDAKILKLACKGTEEDAKDSCHYEITQVSCARPGDVVNIVAMGAVVERPTAKCGAEAVSIWKPPRAPARNRVCNVSVAWTGTKECKAIVTAKFHGNEKNEETGAKTKLVTFVDVRELLFECKGSGDGKCSYSIVSTECK